MRTFDEILEAAMNDLSAAAPAQGHARPVAGTDVAAQVADATARAMFIEATPVGPVWARTLRVSLPCTEGSLKQAFKRVAFETHPDRPGGSHEAFLAVRAAHDEGLAAVRVGGGIALPAPAPSAQAVPFRGRYATSARAPRAASAAVA